MRRRPDPIPLDRQICFGVYSTVMAINRAYRPMLARLGLTFPQYLALHALWEEDGQTVAELARRLMLPTSTVSPMVQRLEAAGLVDRRGDRADERQISTFLTDAGTRRHDEAICLGELLVERSGQSFEELAALNEQVTRFRDSIIDPGEQLPARTGRRAA